VRKNAEAVFPPFYHSARRHLHPASLSSQNVTPRAQRDSGSTFVRQQVVDCSNKSPSEVCVISFDSETIAR
jgi:hypothetical protein